MVAKVKIGALKKDSVLPVNFMAKNTAWKSMLSRIILNNR